MRGGKVTKGNEFGRKVRNWLTHAVVGLSILTSPVTLTNTIGKYKPSPELPVRIVTVRAEETNLNSAGAHEKFYKHLMHTKQTSRTLAESLDRYEAFLNSSAFEKVVEDKEAVKAELIKRLERGRVKWSNGTPLVLYRSGGMEFGAFLTIDGAIHIGMNGQGIWIPLEDLQEIYYERTGRELEINSYMTREEQLELLKIAVEWFFDNYVLDAKIYRHKETGAELGVFFYKDFRESERTGSNIYYLNVTYIIPENDIATVLRLRMDLKDEEVAKLYGVTPMANVFNANNTSTTPWIGVGWGFKTGKGKMSIGVVVGKRVGRNRTLSNVAATGLPIDSLKEEYISLKP